MGTGKLITFAFCSVLAAWAWPQTSTALTEERERELRYLVRQDCGSCHGMTLKGGLGPPLTAEALADRSDGLLTATILDGRPGTAMPPWRPFLSEEETAWIVEQLTAGTVSP